MKKFYNKIKLSLMTLWIAIISFSSKVFGQATADPRGLAGGRETMYGVSYTPEQPDSSMPITMVIKIVQILLILVIPIIGIINLIKIRKINDKTQKARRIRTTIIILAILVLILIAAFLMPALLLK